MPDDQPKKETCKWKVDDIFGYYNTSCDEVFEFISSGPCDNGFKFCPYCGKPIEEVK